MTTLIKVCHPDQRESTPIPDKRLSTLINDQSVSTLLKECQAGPLITNGEQNRLACGVMNIDAKHAHSIKTGSKWHANYGHSFSAFLSHNFS